MYARALTKLPSNPDEPWFAAVPLVKNRLSTVLKDTLCVCIEADIKGHKPSLPQSHRATGASELFEAGVPEKKEQDTEVWMHYS